MYPSKMPKVSPVCEALAGLTANEFETLLSIVQPQFDDAERLRLTSRPRRRALGAGRHYELDFEQRVLLASTALRHSPQEWVLCRLFRVSEATVRRIRRRMEPLVRASPQVAIVMSGTAEDRWRQLFEARFDLPYFVVYAMLTNRALTAMNNLM
jgi:hypothetical protein